MLVDDLRRRASTAAARRPSRRSGCRPPRCAPSRRRSRRRLPSATASTSTSIASSRNLSMRSGCCRASRRSRAADRARRCSRRARARRRRSPSRGRRARSAAAPAPGSRCARRPRAPRRRCARCPCGGALQPELRRCTSPNRSRSSARSMASALVPRIGTPAFVERHREVAAASARRTARSRPSGFSTSQMFEHVLERQRLEEQPVGGVVVGRHRLRVAVDHDGLEARPRAARCTACTQQ